MEFSIKRLYNECMVIICTDEIIIFKSNNSTIFRLLKQYLDNIIEYIVYNNKN